MTNSARTLSLPVLVLALLGIAGCAVHGARGEPCTLLGNAQVCLAPLQALSPPHSLWQLELDSGNRQETLLLDVEADADGLQLVGLTPLGQKVLHLKYGTALEVIVRPPAGVDAVTLLLLVQHALWPAGTFAATTDVRVGKISGRVRVAVPARGLVLTMTLLDAP